MYLHQIYIYLCLYNNTNHLKYQVLFLNISIYFCKFFRYRKKEGRYSFLSIFLLLTYHNRLTTFIYFFSSKIASTKPRNNGCALFGRDFNSGCACVPTKNGWFLTSILSTRRPSGDVPEITSPASLNC